MSRYPLCPRWWRGQFTHSLEASTWCAAGGGVPPSELWKPVLSQEEPGGLAVFTRPR